MEELAFIAGKYRIDAEIGRGGMGIVYAATHVGLEQRVAIKVLPASAVDDADATQRLLREARAAARIRPRPLSETSLAVTVQPCSASHIASPPSPAPTSSARPGFRPETSFTRVPLALPLHSCSPP